MSDLIKIDNKYIKAEIRGENKILFKIIPALAKIYEEIETEKELEQKMKKIKFSKKLWWKCQFCSKLYKECSEPLPKPEDPNKPPVCPFSEVKIHENEMR